MAATSAAWSAPPSMRTSLVSRSTLTAATPSTLVTSSVTATLQWSQVIPGTRYMVVMRGVLGIIYREGVSAKNRTRYPRGVSYTLAHGHHHRHHARVHIHQGAAPEAPQARRGPGSRRREDGRGGPLLHRRPDADLRDPGRARQGRARPDGRPRPPLRDRRPLRGQGGAHRGADGRRRPPDAPGLTRQHRNGR